MKGGRGVDVKMKFIHHKTKHFRWKDKFRNTIFKTFCNAQKGEILTQKVHAV